MANSWGGRRPGAGRKPGSKTKKTAIIAQQARDAGISPLEVRLNTMRRLWQRHQDSGDLALAAQACAIAREAAPFCHPRFCGIAYQELGSDGKPKADAPVPGVTINVRFVSATTPKELPAREASPDVPRPIEQSRAIEHDEPVPVRAEAAVVSLVQRPAQRCWDANGFSGRPFRRIAALR